MQSLLPNIQAASGCPWSRLLSTAPRVSVSGSGQAMTVVKNQILSWLAAVIHLHWRPWLLLRSFVMKCRNLKIRVVNVVDLFKLESDHKHPHGLSDAEYDAIFTKDKPVIFAFHGYPTLIHELTYGRQQPQCFRSRISGRRYHHYSIRYACPEPD